MTYQTINPATGKLFKTYEDISDAALNEVMDVAQACYENDWRRRSVAQRAGIVHAAATRMRQQSDHLAGLMTLEMGKLIGCRAEEVVRQSSKRARPLTGIPQLHAEIQTPAAWRTCCECQNIGMNPRMASTDHGPDSPIGANSHRECRTWLMDDDGDDQETVLADSKEAAHRKLVLSSAVVKHTTRGR